MKRILVLGAGGFIGGAMVKRLKEEGHWVRGVDLKYHEYFDITKVCSAVGSFKKLKNKILEINNQFRVKVKGSENKIVIADLGEQGA